MVPGPRGPPRCGRNEGPLMAREATTVTRTHPSGSDTPLSETTLSETTLSETTMSETTMSETNNLVDMSVNLSGMRLPNPLMTASGCAANGKELHRFLDIAELGAFVTKTVLADPRSGRGTPRMAETPSGMLNSIGLQGPGIEGLLADDLPWLARRGARAFVSIAGTRVEH